ncbi:MAG: hypothetical protein U0800_21175 [Isosphaeraceae bacterium]
MRVFIPGPGLNIYHDVVIFREKPAFEDDVFDTLLNPTVLVEVLSRQPNPITVVGRRSNTGASSRFRNTCWSRRIAISSIGVSILLAEVYRRVAFPEVPPSAGPPPRPAAPR